MGAGTAAKNFAEGVNAALQAGDNDFLSFGTSFESHARNKIT
jgi:hypothetical protein